jgi:16S rRNA (cytosine967-C5)-methyltransferase
MEQQPKAPRRALSPARRVAYQTLRRVAESPLDPAALLHSSLTEGLGPADLDLSTELVYGTLRWQAYLDFVLEAHARRSVREIDLPLLLALRLGLYQIRFLTRVPQRAAVDESVRLAHTFGRPGGARLVNAVLRSVCRRFGFPPLPAKQRDPLAYLTVTLSHPGWLARRWLERYGLEGAEALCQRNNLSPPVDLRIEPPLDADEARRRLDQEGVRAEPLPLVPGALRVISGKPQATALYRSGALHLQEGGSQLIALLLAPGPEDWVLDACASPGGKTTALARRAASGGVLAIDRSLDRLALVGSLAQRLGLTNVRLLAADSLNLPLARAFSRVLLDAPCSNLGTLSRNPDIKWRLRESDLERQAARQRRLLESCAAATAAGGKLVYATCSTEPEENEELVAAFLADHPEWAPDAPPPSFPEPARLRLTTASGGLRIEPARDQLDGYFAIVLRRRPFREMRGAG